MTEEPRAPADERNRPRLPERPGGISLRARVFLLALGVLPVLITAAFVLQREWGATLREGLRLRGENFANHFGRFVQDAMLSNSWAELDARTPEFAAGDPDILRIAVHLPTGRLAAGEEPGPADPKREIRITRDIFAEIDAERALHKGRVTIVYSTARTDGVVRNATLALGAGACLLAVLIGGGLLVGLRRLVVSPIRELADYAEAVGAASEPPRLRRANQAEFGLLAGTLESARHALAARDRALRSQFESVRQAYLQLEAILQSLGEGVLVADEDGRVVLTNVAVEDLLGPVESVERCELRELLPAPEGEARGGPPPLPREGEPPLSLVGKSGRRLIRWNVARVPGEGRGRIRWIAVLRDITRETEDAAMKDEFVASVSHELRTPLTSILSFTEILLEVPPDDAETRSEFLGIVRREAERMSALVNDIIDIARLEGGSFKFQILGCDPVEVATGAAEPFVALAAASRVALRVDASSEVPSVAADPKRLQQVLANLLSNALKFTPEGGRVTLAVRRETSRGPSGDRAWVLFEVSDTGRGIAIEDQDRIFDKFVQVGNQLVDKPRGTGLGLPISRSIVHRLGGTLRLTSAIGRGSTFTVRLPAYEETPGPPATARSAAGEPARV